MTAEPSIIGYPAYQVAVVTHPGNVRNTNEDAICIEGEILTEAMPYPYVPSILGSFHMALVADGLGGHACGEVASVAALEYLATGWEERKDVHGWTRALQLANDGIYDLMGEKPFYQGMGTTVVGAVFGADLLIVFNIGDSRAYRFSRGSLIQISEDDTQRLWPGVTGGRTHIITQCLGGRAFRTQVRPHVFKAAPLQPKEALLLCSDGLTDMLDNDRIRVAMLESKDHMECATKLLNLALVAGAHDNVSIVIVRAV